MPILKPTGVPVPKPDGGYLAAEGEPIVMSVYWRRRINDLSVIEKKPEVVSPPAPELTPEISANLSAPTTKKPAARRRGKAQKD